MQLSGPVQVLPDCARRGSTRGRQPLLWGEPAASMRAKRLFLARSVLPAWGELTPPRLALGGNRKGGLNSLLPQAISVIFAQRTETIAPRKAWRLVVLFFAASCSVSRQPPVASLPFALGNEQSFACPVHDVILLFGRCNLRLRPSVRIAPVGSG